MGSTQSFWKNVKQFVKRAGLCGMPLFLFACASTPAQQTTASDNAEPSSEQIETQSRQELANTDTANLPLTPELIYYILTAEIAGQRGEMGVAVDLYQRAAELVDSPELASRSAQVATFSRNQQRINRALERWIEVDPGDADVYIMQAPFLMLDGDYDGVVKAVDNALALEPDKAKVYLDRISENLSEMADPEQALSTLEQLQLFKQNHPAAHFAYARMAAFYKDYNKALATLDPLLAAAQNEDYLVLKAEILQRTNRADEGLNLLAKAAKHEDASNELRFTYGKLLGESGQIEEAREIFDALHAENPNNRDVLFALGLLALEEKNGQEAKSYFSQLLKVGDPTQQAAYFMGLAEELNGNIDAALVWYASVPAQSHRFDAAQTQYINLLAERGQIDKAREHLKLMRHEQPRRALQFYLFEAGFLREQSLPQAAFDLLTEALEQYPQNNEVLYSRAMVAESLDKLDVLEADLRMILAKEPDNAQALNALGYTLTDRTDRHQEALQLINKALQIKPGDPFYLDSLGWVYYRLGDLEKAEKYLREAIQIQPDVEFIAHLGEVLWEQGKKDEAMQVWQQGIKQDSDNKLLRETMRRYGK
ncbi:tetratricopeptide repeat protein [Methylophaga sp. OBS4]|uniref:tetratricopeptide repeat protein n=1 Tax=Methylophaga sp. OBS4 TaxID=2991935 RepID=UPI00224C846F|nr:tetratricopeptide repeat protein [Methylophaga sp. OBS4]MCX4187012.1 tetratricopeptide repeat protein [Methylophaga sp. OBS4]